MASLNPIALSLVGLSALAFCAFAYCSIILHRSKGELPWRGIVKLVSLQGDTAPEAMATPYKRWRAAFAAFYFLTCICVAVVVWGSDHSFFIVIFPLLFYYFFARYFLWEKQDLTD